MQQRFILKRTIGRLRRILTCLTIPGVPLFLAVACASTGPVSSHAVDVNSAPPAVALAVRTNTKCKPLFKKTVVYGLFIVPMNPLRMEEVPVPKSEGPRYLRFRQVAEPSDILYTILGFMFSILTHTEVVEDCGTGEAFASLNEPKEARLLRNLGVVVHLVYPSETRDVPSQDRPFRVIFRSVKYREYGSKKQDRTVIHGDSLKLQGGQLVLEAADGSREAFAPEDVLAVHIRMGGPHS